VHALFSPSGARRSPAAWASALLIVGACTGSSPAPQTEAEPASKTPSSAPLSPWPARTLLLRSPGEAPLSPLRVAVGEAALELRFSSEALVLGELGGAPVDQVRLRSTRSVAVRAKPVDGENSFDYTILSYHDEAGLPEAEQAAIDAALTGLVGAWRSDGRCAVSGAGVGPAPEAAARVLPSVSAGLVDLCPLLPEEPIGRGARWTVTVGSTAPGDELEVTDWLLLEREPGRAVLSFELRAERVDANGGRRQNLGEGRVELHDGLLLPLRADARGVSTREGSTAGQPLRTTTEWSSSITAALPEPSPAAPATTPH